MHGVRAAQLVAGHLGQPQRTDLAGLDQLGHRAGCLLDLGVLRGAVQVVQVDLVGAQPRQRRVAAAQDVAAGPADPQVTAGEVQAELGRDLHLVPAVMDRAADEDLVVPGAVDIGGVE
jgi:hypothetical protein